MSMSSVDRAQVVRDEHFHGLADQLVARVPEDQLGLPVDDGNHALHIDDDDGIRGHFQETLESYIRGTPVLRHQISHCSMLANVVTQAARAVAWAGRSSQPSDFGRISRQEDCWQRCTTLPLNNCPRRKLSRRASATAD